jgi:hypothetical protein
MRTRLLVFVLAAGVAACGLVSSVSSAALRRMWGTSDETMKRASLTFLVFVTMLAASLLGGGAAQANGGARYDFRVFPRVGKPTTTFRISFTAPFPAIRADTDYFLEAVGPRRCPSLFEYAGVRVRRGDRVVLRLTSSDDLYFRSRRRWCRGSYVGFVNWSGPGLQERVIGYFSFGVGRFPVSLGG